MHSNRGRCAVISATVSRNLPLVLALASCVIAGNTARADSPAAADPPVCREVEPGPTPPRRLTRVEYNNTVRDLLGDDSAPADRFAAEESALGFTNNATVLVVSPLLAEQYMRAAEGIAARAVEHLPRLIPCAPGTPGGPRAGTPACARAFVDLFGRRAFRRPLQPEERARLLRLFAVGRRTSFRAGIETVIQAVLQSPAFFYRDAPAPGAGPGQVVKLDGWALATRLSYLLWATTPDDRLLARAAAGGLATAADVEAEARRMLADPRARAVVATFNRQWLTLDRIDRIDKSRSDFKDFDSALNGVLREEIERFLDHVIWEGPGDFATLLTSPVTFLDGRLAAFYGVPGIQGPTFRQVTLDPRQRAGFLTHAGLQALLAGPNQTSPILRGKFVREKLLCEHLPDPPADVEVNPPKLDPKLSTRERFADHTLDVGCNRCHRLIDPIGFGFESYDGLGRFRTEEHGRPLDVTGEVEGSDIAGPFDGAIELMGKLARSDQARRCLVTHWFRFAYGRGETPADRCTLARLERAFGASGHVIKELIVALTQTDAFLYRRGAPP